MYLVGETFTSRRNTQYLWMLTKGNVYSSWYCPTMVRMLWNPGILLRWGKHVQGSLVTIVAMTTMASLDFSYSDPTTTLECIAQLGEGSHYCMNNQWTTSPCLKAGLDVLQNHPDILGKPHAGMTGRWRLLSHACTKTRTRTTTIRNQFCMVQNFCIFHTELQDGKIWNSEMFKKLTR